MRTDTLFYQLFQTFHTLLFELTEQPVAAAAGYEFVSVEVKEKAFRFDGVFLPDTVEKPIIFTEVQFQRKDNFYQRLVAGISLYIEQYEPEEDWQAVAIFARRSYDPGVLKHYREFFASNRITRIYLEDWLDRKTNSLGILIVQLILTSEAEAPEFAKQLAVQVEQETTPLQREEIVEFIETVLIYKFPKLSREEIQAMFTLDDLKQTRYYQETKQEGVLEGMQRGMLEGMQQGQSNLILRLLVRKFGGLSEESRSNIAQLSPAQIEGLAEAILDFTSVTELDRWLQENK